MAVPGKVPSDQVLTGPIAPNPAYPLQNVTPYPQQPYPPQGLGVSNPALAQPPPYTGPPQAGYQQPYPQPGYQQQGGVYPDQKAPLPQQQPNVVVVQNTPQPTSNVIVRTVQVDAGSPPENHLVMSIISIFCCLIFGIVALIYSSRVSALWAQGLHAEARSSAATAKGFAIAAIIIGVIIIALNIILQVVAVNSSPYEY